MIEIKISNPALYRFLGGHFHQDIESQEAALNEYLIEISKQLNERDLLALTEFKNSDYSEEDKINFIEEAADGIYSLKMISHLECLIQFTEQIKHHIKTL
ncbi:hypothetical protein P8841_06025 [Bacillus spizizenii]|nr:hypothetical protein [Bacillus spizizenii]MCY7920966.1 hypothetical protein [Bacillus spizizenii]MCY8759505.1 hypothetical protein [Bacillus spizizenii]MEC0565342.1 hypothetical protein [Bacillus spizizenii]MEC1568677.1 hypothetical protein [Bacillus spizizenii]